MAEWKEGCEREFVEVAVPNVDVFAVERPTAFGAVVDVGGVVLEAARYCEWKFRGLKRAVR